MSEPETRVHHRTCPLCEATCGLELTVLGDRITRVRGDREDVFSKGFICPKGASLGHLVHDPDRLRTPLVRRDGELVPASWDEAFAAVAEGFGRIWADGDRNAVAIYLGNPNAHTVAGTMFGRPLIQSFGTRNLFSASTVDQMPKHVSAGLMFGNPGAIPVPDLDRTAYLLMLGANPVESNGSLCTAPDFPGRLAAIRERGGQVVVVDPRRTRTAELADRHVAIRPGTDALWLAALVTEVANLGPLDLGNLEGLAVGADEAVAALAPFDADSVAAHTRVPADETRRVAAELAAAPTAAVYGRIGTHTTELGTTASWLVDLLNALTGNLDREGGAMFPTPAAGRPDRPGGPKAGKGFRTGRWHSRVSGHPEVRGELPVAALAEEITTPGPGQVRGLLTVAGNPVRSCPDSDALDAALGSLEFMVSVDIYLNETSRHADVVLPSPSPVAKPHFDLAFHGLSVRNVVNYSPPLWPADAPGEPGLDEHEILARLALIASGMGPEADPEVVYDLMAGQLAAGAGLEADAEADAARAATRPPAERLIDLVVRSGAYPDLDIDVLLAHPHGIDRGPLRPRVASVLRTESARVELAPEPLLADVARLVERLATEPEDGLLLVGRRHLRSNNSWMHNVGVLTKGRVRCTLQVHPDDAARRGLVDGGTASVRSASGAVEALVEVTADVAPGTVSLPHGWGHDAPGTRMSVAAATTGPNSNVLTPAEPVDPLSGNARLNAIPVEVVPAG